MSRNKKNQRIGSTLMVMSFAISICLNYNICQEKNQDTLLS